MKTKKNSDKNLKGGEKEMEKVMIETQAYKDTCPICLKEIIGSTINQVQYNMKVHLMTHEKTSPKLENAKL